MKNIYIIILLLICGCSQVEFPWIKITFLEAQTLAIHNNKMIMIDFYADW